MKTTEIDLRKFEFEGQGVRMTVRDDEPWFIGRDVCRVLDIQKPENAFVRLDADEKDTHTMGTLGGPQTVTIINESGLYSLILTSRKPAAKRFKKWVTREVLPTLRRTGAYVMDAGDEDLPALADGKVFGVKVAKVNAAARMIAVANSIYGPEAARALWEAEPGLPVIAGKSVGRIAGSAADDPVGCFRHLMRAAAGNGRSVGQVLSLAIHDRPAARAVRALGIIVDPAEAPGMVAIANQHAFLARVYAETQWIGDWRIALAQLPSARPSKGRIGFEGNQSQAVMISRGEVLALLNPVSSLN